MAERLEVYKCNICGNIVMVLHGGKGELVCCGEPMKLQKANTVDAAKEKHVPVVEKIDGGVKVKVGSVPHPMADEHFIEIICLIDGEYVCMKFLKPGGAPEAEFKTSGGQVTALEYCNLHGLWKA